MVVWVGSVRGRWNEGRDEKSGKGGEEEGEKAGNEREGVRVRVRVRV